MKISAKVLIRLKMKTIIYHGKCSLSRHVFTYGKHGGVIPGKEGLELHCTRNPLYVDETI